MTMDGDSSSLVPKAVRAIVCVGVDLAKNVFAIHCVDDVGKEVWGHLISAIRQPDRKGWRGAPFLSSVWRG